MKTTVKLIPAFIALAVLGACSGNSDQKNTLGDSVVKDSAAIAEAVPAAVDTTLQLTPGIAAGQVHIGQNAEEVYASLGKPDDGDAAMQKAVAIWYKDHDKKSYATSIYTVRDTGDNPAARVKQIRITTPAFKTADGVGVSSTLDEIKGKYTLSELTDVKSAESDLAIHDSLKGIAFETDKQGICKAIIIHKSNEALHSTYLPLR